MTMLAHDPVAAIKADLIRLAAAEAYAHVVTVSAVLRALADGEMRPGFSDEVDHYTSLRGLAREQALSFATDLVMGPIGLPELAALIAAYEHSELTADQATEVVAWARRVQQASLQWQRTREAIVTIAHEFADEEGDAEAFDAT